MQFANSSTLTYNLQVNKDKKYFLYENSVQNPEGDIEFINEKFSTVRGKYPISLREDFGGTGPALLPNGFSKDPSTALP